MYFVWARRARSTFRWRFQRLATPSPTPVTPTDKQIQFARHNFDNLQNLIRFSDTKAAALTTLVIFLGATLIPVAKDVLPLLHWATCISATLSVFFIAASLSFICALGVMLTYVQAIIKPRGATHYSDAKVGRELMWQDHVIQHGTNSAYLSALQEASEEILLRNTSDQVFELSHISKQKMDAFHRARRVFWLVFASWALSVVFGILLLRWK